MKILSITIPTYNVEKYLARTLDSLLMEERILDKIELLIVNDGSKDGSLAIAQAYEARYPQCVRVIDKENGGHGSTVNVGMREATGKYFRVIDSDDWVNIDDFPAYVDRLEELDVDVVLTNYRREEIFSGMSTLFEYTKKIPRNEIIDLDTFDFRLFNDDYFFMATSTFKTEVLRKANVQLQEKTFYVDMEFVLLPFPYFTNFIYLDYDIYRYFIGRKDQSTSISSFVRNRAHHDRVLRRLLSYNQQAELTGSKKAYFRNVLSLMCNTHYTIYCCYELPNRKALQEIRLFDAFFKETNPELYERTSNRYSYIRFNQKTNFHLAQWLHRGISRYLVRQDTKEEKAVEKKEEEA